MTTATILNDLMADPKSFLRHYVLIIIGGKAATSGVASGVATFSCDAAGQTMPGFTTGISGLRGLTKNREKIRFMKVAMPPRDPRDADEFNAWYIAMAVMGSGAKTTHFPVPGTGGPDLLLTSQLSGCTFGVGSITADGSRLISHIQPLSGGLDATTRAKLHDETVDRMTDGVDAVFEREGRPGARRYGDPHNRASVVGIRRGAAWEFWAQEYQDNSDTQNAPELYGVKRIL
jgi:hypothetical protein